MKRALATILILFCAQSVLAVADYTELAARTVSLRHEVENLNAEGEAEQRKQRAESDALLARKTEVESQLRKERLRALQLSEKSLALNSKLKADALTDPKGDEVVKAWLAGLHDITERSIPFRKHERLAEITSLRERLSAGESATSILPALWEVTHAQFRLARDNAFEVATIELPGQEPMKAEIARLGLAQMAFLTPDGQTGFAVFENGKWSLKAATDSASNDAAMRLVSKFRNKAVSGYFQIPRSNIPSLKE